MQLHIIIAIEGGGHGKRVQVQGPVREHHALGRARAPAGIKQFCGRSLVAGENVSAFRPAAREQLLISEVGLGDLFIECDEFLDAGAGWPQLLHQRRKIIFEQQQACFRMVEDGDQLRLRQAHVQRHDDAARLDHAEIAFEELMVIEAEISDALAGPQSLRFQRRSQPLGARAELGIGETARTADDTDFLSVQIHRPMHASNRRQRHDHERSRLSFQLTAYSFQRSRLR